MHEPKNYYLFKDTGVKKIACNFAYQEVQFTAMSDWRSQVAGNGPEWEVKTIELS